jgi:hypothetical protein
VNGAASRFVFRDDGSFTPAENAAAFVAAYVIPWDAELSLEPTLSESAALALASVVTTRRVPGPCDVPAPPSRSGTPTPSRSNTPSATVGTSPSASPTPYPTFEYPPGYEYYYDSELPASITATASPTPRFPQRGDLQSSSGAAPSLPQRAAFLVTLAVVVAAALW